MEEPAFPFYGHGDESRAEHCFDCGRALPDEGDPAVIYVRVTQRDGVVEVVPSCRRHWREVQASVTDLA
jgi:hypothetical protein